MLAWLSANIGTIAVLAVLAAVVAAIVIGLVSDKKKGKKACTCDCSHCAMSGQCHKNS